MSRPPLPSDYAERVYAGVLGKIIGVYLGRPFEQWHHDRISRELGEVLYYVHDRLGQPLIVTDDDISGTFTFLRALPDYGNDPRLTPEQIGQTWLNYIIENRTILWWGGMGMSTEHTAYLRLKRGIKAPESGSAALNGRTVAEQIGAQIFIDGWGMICPGDPERAADFARRAGSVSHDGEAIYGAQVIAAIEALAFEQRDIDTLIDVGVAQIPADSVLARMIADVRSWHASGIDWREGFRRIEAEYGYGKFGGGCHMVPNHALIIHSLLHGGGDFARSQMIVNTCGYDTDCNAGNVGCILGIRNGLAAFEGGPDWRGPVADRMYLPTADGGRCITDAVREALCIVNIAREMGAEAPFSPKEGARFHFCFPGSVQGFARSGTTSSDGVLAIRNEEGRLAIHYRDLAPGAAVRAGTPTFTPPDARKMGGYGVMACPTLYPGQVVRCRVSAADENLTGITAGLYLAAYGPDDALRYFSGEEAFLEPGDAAVLTWIVPEVGGYPIAEVGIEATSAARTSGVVDLDFLTWEGAPDTTFVKTESGTAWRETWVNGVDHYHDWEEPFRLIQDEGTGLLIQGCREWQDYEVSSTVAIHLVERAGIAARVQGMCRWIGLFLCRDGYVRLVKSLDGERTLAEAAFPWEFGGSYELTIRCDGSRITGSVGDRLVLEATDENRPLDGGGVAFVLQEGRIGSYGMAVRPLSR